MNRSELTEMFKIIYDSLNDGKDSEKEITQLKDNLKKRNILIKYLLCIMFPIVQSTLLSINSNVTPYDLARYINDVLKNKCATFQVSIDDKFIDELINQLIK